MVVDLFRHVYPEVGWKRDRIQDELDREESKFERTLERGLREYHKVAEQARARDDRAISGAEAFDLFETFGFPLPFTVELAREQELAVDEINADDLDAALTWAGKVVDATNHPIEVRPFRATGRVKA